MSPHVCTLLADGSSDRVLLHMIRWVAGRRPGVAVDLEFANLSVLPNPPQLLPERAAEALRLYPSTRILFVHRDAERETFEARRGEIERGLHGRVGRYVAVVPVRMTEAWLLFDQASIRRAAGNPSGTQSLRLPAIPRLELIPDPKAKLHESLRSASGLRGRRLKSFHVSEAVHRLGSLIPDFEPLVQLPAFAAFVHETEMALAELDPDRAASMRSRPRRRP